MTTAARDLVLPKEHSGACFTEAPCTTCKTVERVTGLIIRAERTRAEKLEKALRDAARSFESIQIRCREGDKTVDWLPTIDNIATNARVAALAAGGAS